MSFVLNTKYPKFPALRKYPEAQRVLATVKSKSKTIVGDFEIRRKVDYIPQPGLQESVCASECNLIFMCGQGTAGKAQPYDAHVLTPSGFVEMGSIRVGDVICGVDGKSQKVLKIYEQGEKDIFRLTFDDGASTECCGEHLWKVYRKTSKNTYSSPKVLQLFDMIADMSNNRDVRYAIPMTSAVEFEESELPIPPYLLGRMLGDGCDYNINDLALNQNLKKLGLTDKHSNDKFVPKQYKYASMASRKQFLQGLINSDGTVVKKGCIAFYSVSLTLAKDVQWIVRSLGGSCSITTKHTRFTYKGEEQQGQTCYILKLCTPHNTKLARSSRKKNRAFDGFRHRGSELRRRLIKVEPSGRKQCRCILVENADHLYITDDFVVTHNTFSMYLKALSGIDRQDFKARLISVRGLDSKKGSSIFADGMKVCGVFAGCEAVSSDIPTFSWARWNSNLQLIHSNFNYGNPEDKKRFEDYAKKNQASLIMIDEATEMNHFGMFSFWFMRNRDDSGMPPQMILSFNPLHEHWTTEMLRDAGYLGSDWFLRKDMIGKVRYFYVKGDTPAGIIWGDTREEVVAAAKPKISQEDREAGLTELDMVKSFTVFTGTAADNRELVYATGGQSVANLHAVGGTQRAIVGEAYFGPVDNEDVNVNRQMVHELWENPINDDENMYATMDVSGGNTDSDNCPMCIFKGNSLITVKTFRGDPKQLVGFIDGTLQQYGVPVSNFAFDATGIGNYLRAYTSGVPLTANRRAIQEYDSEGNAVSLDAYFNLRSQLLSRLEVMLQKGELNFAIPKDLQIQYGKKGEYRRVFDIICDELDVMAFTTRQGKRYAKSKEEYKAKHKHSPDLLDTIMLFMYFFLDARPKKQPTPKVPDNAYFGLYHNQRTSWETSGINW